PKCSPQPGDRGGFSKRVAAGKGLGGWHDIDAVDRRTGTAGGGGLLSVKAAPLTQGKGLGMTGFATKTMLAAALIGGATLAYAKDMMMPD
ncbi:hypothetical protein ABTK62_20335, partial [Acinetobacter baumannii]